MPYGGLLEFGLNDSTGWLGLPFGVFTLGLIGIGRWGSGELKVGELESR